jgi:hypothetical protein
LLKRFTEQTHGSSLDAGCERMGSTEAGRRAV